MRLVPLASIGTFASAGVVFAGPTVMTFDTEAAFLGATARGSLNAEDFEAMEGTIGSDISIIGGVTGHQVTFDSAPGALTSSDGVMDVVVGDFGPTDGVGLYANFFDDDLKATFNPGVNAVGSNVDSLLIGGEIKITLMDSSGEIFNTTIDVSNDFQTYFGFIVQGGMVMDVTYASQNSPNEEAEGVDNFMWGVIAIPLPAPVVMASMGLGLVVVRRPQRDG